MRVCLTLAGLALLGGCFLPAEHGVSGHPCVRDSDCGSAGACVNEVCGAPGVAPGSTPPPNLLINGGFERGLDAGDWLADSDSTGLQVQSGTVRSGHSAAEVTALTTGTSDYDGLQLNEGVVTQLTPNATYCVEAWVNVVSMDLTRRLDLRGYVSDPTGASLETHGTSISLQDGVWHLLQLQAVATPPYVSALTLRLLTHRVPSLKFFVDDVRVWQPDGGVCPP